MEKKRNFTLLKIIITLLYLGITVFLLGAQIDAINAEGEGVQLGIALTYAIIVVLIGGISYGVTLIVSTIGLIVSAVAYKRGSAEFKSVLYFIIFTGLIIITYLLLVILIPIFVN